MVKLLLTNSNITLLTFRNKWVELRFKKQGSKTR